MTIRSVGFALRTEGKAEVKNDFAEVRAAGATAMDSVADAAEKAGARAARSLEEIADRQAKANARITAAAQTAGLNSPRPQAYTANGQSAADLSSIKLAAALKAELDPAWAAAQTLNRELERLARIEKLGVLSAGELATAQANARKRFDETTDAIKRQAGAGGGLSKNQKQTLIYTASDIIGSSANGINPGQLLMQQGPQVLQAFAAEEGGMAALRATLTGTAAAIAAVTGAAIVGAVAWSDYSSSAAKLSAAARGAGIMLGLSGDELMRSAEAAADAGRISVSSARDIESGYLAVARSGDVLVKMTAITRDYAAATGQDMAGAQRELAAAFADPIAGADDLATKYGVLTQAQAERITKLVEENDLAGAQRVLIDALGPAFLGAADNANALARGWESIKNAASDAWNWMGKALDRMATGGTIAQRIQQLQQDRARGPSVGQMLLGTSTAEFQSGIDREVAGLQRQLQQEATRSAQARANASQAAAQGVVDRYTGDQRGQLRADAARLRAALRTDLPADQRSQMTSTLQAYSNAIDTWMPKQEKANKLAALDAQIAAAKTPAAKAALAADRARVEMAGQVATSADVEARATSAGTRAREGAAKSGDRHAESLRRQAEATEASARAALDVADAYLKSSAAGVTAEARRKALTDATRRGIDVDAQVRRQLELQSAETIATGGKAVAQLRDETSARQAVLAQYRDGAISIEGVSDALADEAALRPLVRLRTIAQGAALESLNKVIVAYRDALGQAHEQESQFGLEKALAASIERAGEAKAAIADLALAPLDQALNAANRAANREADDLKLAPGSEGRVKLVDTRVDEARQRYAESRARYLSDAATNQADGIEMTRRELDLVGASDTVRAAELDKLRRQQEIRRQFPDMAQADVEAVMRGVDAQAQANDQLKVAAAAMAEVKGFGEQLVDTLDPSQWDSWGDAGKGVLSMLKSEFIKLALLNPLKNLINGNSNGATLTSAIGSIGKLFSRTTPGTTPPIAGNATGTEHFSGGMTWVNENGGEIMDLPNGTRIYPAAETRRMLANANDNAGTRGGSFHFDLRGAVVTQDLLDQMNSIGDTAATRGAAGGAALGRANTRAAAGRKLGRR